VYPAYGGMQRKLRFRTPVFHPPFYSLPLVVRLHAVSEVELSNHRGREEMFPLPPVVSLLAVSEVELSNYCGRLNEVKPIGLSEAKCGAGSGWRGIKPRSQGFMPWLAGHKGLPTRRSGDSVGTGVVSVLRACSFNEESPLTFILSPEGRGDQTSFSPWGRRLG
jgi:hypothetical protein